MKKKEPKLVFKGFRDVETGNFEPLPSPSELKRLLKIMGDVICGNHTKHAGSPPCNLKKCISIL